MSDQAIVINVDKLVETLAAAQTHHAELTEKLAALKIQLAKAEHDANSRLDEKRLSNEVDRDRSRYLYMAAEAMFRTLRFIVLVAVAWIVVSCNGETLLQVFRSPASTADVAQRLAALLDVKQDERRQANIKQLRECMQVVTQLLPPAPSPSGPATPPSVPAEKIDTRLRDGDKREVRIACQPLIDR